MNITLKTLIVSLPIGAVVLLCSSQLDSATHPSHHSATIQGIAPPSGGDVGGEPIGGGGHYEGPGDTVPPCDTCTPPPSQCTMSLGYVCGGPECNNLDWVADQLVCKYPQFGNTGLRVWSQGCMLTLGDIIDALQNGTACIDEYGNVTTRVDSPFPVDEVHVFESGWINGYEPAPISQSVSATVCFDGTPTIVGWAFNQVAFDYDCELATVSITFSAACMQQALLGWYWNGTDLGSNSDSWLFYVDFISCDPCEDEDDDLVTGVVPLPK
jgi:hypothetical protein